MSAKKRRTRQSARSFTADDVSRPNTNARLLSARDLNVQREAGYIAECAARGDARIVTLGGLVFFSTAEGDAWMLDAEDSLACCLMEGDERRDTPIQAETEQGFSVAWEAEFTIEGGCFVTRSANGKLTAWPGYPAGDIRKRSCERRTPGGNAPVPYVTGPHHPGEAAFVSRQRAVVESPPTERDRKGTPPPGRRSRTDDSSGAQPR